MEWQRLTTVIGDKDTIEVRHFEKRLYKFNHACLATSSNLHGEYSTTKIEAALRLAARIAQKGGLE